MVTVTFSNEMARTLSREIPKAITYLTRIMGRGSAAEEQAGFTSKAQAYVGFRTLQAKLNEHLRQLDEQNKRAERDAQPVVRESRHFR